MDAAAGNARWDAEVAALFRMHPALNYQQNSAIMQEKLNAVFVPGMTNQQLLDTAYQETVNDRRWSSVP